MITVADLRALLDEMEKDHEENFRYYRGEDMWGPFEATQVLVPYFEGSRFTGYGHARVIHDPQLGVIIEQEEEEE